MAIVPYRSVSELGTTEDFNLQVSRGMVPGHTRFYKFGYNPAVGTTDETICDLGGQYSYLTTATTLTVASSNTDDTDEGILVYVEGLDSDYKVQYEYVTLGATGSATTTKSYLRVYRGYVAGSTAVDGNITVNANSNTYLYISARDQQSMVAVYTVPAGHTLAMDLFSGSTGTTATTNYVTLRTRIRPFGGVFRTGHQWTVQGNQFQYNFLRPFILPEKTDIEVRAQSSTGDQEVSSMFEGILFKNNTDESGLATGI